MKYFRLTIVVFITLLWSTSLLAQTKLDGKGVVKGVVSDKSSKAIIEFATVSLFNASDSSLVTGAITGSSGEFEIAKVPNGNYYVKIDFIGFAPTQIPDVVISNSQKEIDLGKVELGSFSENMDQFEFVDEKELMEIKIDKKNSIIPICKIPRTMVWRICFFL